MALSAPLKDTDGEGYYYPGPVARAYETDFSHRKTFIAGPTGGGKTFSSSRKCLNATLIQKPSVKDHIRRAKIVVICPTYIIMQDTVIASFKKVGFGEGKGREWKGSDYRQQTFLYKAALQDGSNLDMMVDFRAVGDLDYDEFFRGRECTGFWLPEADTSITKEMMGYLANRWGREYLQHVAKGQQLSWYGVFGDSNTPFVGSFFHELFYLQLIREELVASEDGSAESLGAGGLKLHKQPAGFDPNSPDGWPRDADGNITAENHQMLMKRNPRYYLEAARDMGDKAMIKRLLQCIPTSQRFGLPVHEDFNADFHATHMRLTPDPWSRVYIGVDTGFKPAAVFYQRTVWGQWRAFFEIAPMDQQMDLQELGYAIKQVLIERFDGAKGGALICIDPAGKKGLAHNREVKEWQIVQKASGVPVQFPRTNSHDVRKTALDRLLKRSDFRDGKSEPGLLISRDGCPNFIRALAGGYSYAKRGEKITPEVDKNSPWTHVAEAGQYAPMVVEGVDGFGGNFTLYGEAGKSAKPAQVQRKQRSY